MKLQRLDVTHESKGYYRFTIRVEYKTFWRRKKVESFDCFRKSGSTQSHFISDGKHVWSRWLWLDDSINAILDTADCYLDCN